MDSSSYHVVQLDVAEAGAELTEAILYANECIGLEEESHQNKTRIKAYFNYKEPLSQLIASLTPILPQAENIQGTTISLQDIRFQPRTFEPLELCPQVWVVPPEDMPTATHITSGKKIVIRPGAAFGTGRHESTRLAAEIMTNTRGPTRNSLLDLGTGSGVLAIYAKFLKIETVAAVEIDQRAQKNALENFGLNGQRDIHLYSDLSDVKGKYDIIVANLLTPTILNLKEMMSHVLNKNGLLVLSGITDNEGIKIEQAFKDFQLTRRKQQNEWVAYCFKKEA